jgi:hypothetical protein
LKPEIAKIAESGIAAHFRRKPQIAMVLGTNKVPKARSQKLIANG